MHEFIQSLAKAGREIRKKEHSGKIAIVDIHVVNMILTLAQRVFDVAIDGGKVVMICTTNDAGADIVKQKLSEAKLLVVERENCLYLEF